MEEKNTNDLFYQEQVASFNQEQSYKDSVTQVAKKTFGINYLYPWQRLVIANILDSFKQKDFVNKEDNQDLFCYGKQIVLLPTGAGKSLCFLVPSIIIKGVTLIIYPLLALMLDQKRRIEEANIECVVFRGGQTKQERELCFTKIKNGAKIILTNPEVLQNKELLLRLCKCNIKHIAIDEAHCVSQWGSTFRPSYLELGKIIKEVNAPVVTAFTATASQKIIDEVSNILFNGKVHIVKSQSDRQNIHYSVINAFAKKRTAFNLAVTEQKPLLIFCGTRAKAQDMARELSAYYKKDKVKFYHAGMQKEEKEFVENWFYNKTDGILCCTCAYGMGVDKKDIRTIIHLEASPSVESYVQESGRGGRDGKVCNAFLLWSPLDSKKNVELKKFAEANTCRRQVLLNALNAELAYCSGCDVCKRGGKAPFANDALVAWHFIWNNRFLYTENTLIQKLQQQLNKRDFALLKTNVWDSKDCKEIIYGLKNESIIEEKKLFWKNKVSVIKPSLRHRHLFPQKH